MIITYFYSLKLVLYSEYADQRGAREGVSQSPQERGGSLRRGVPGKGEKASEGGSQERGKIITKGWPGRVGGEASERDLVPEH